MIRAFVAIAVPPEVRDMLEATQAGLRIGKLVEPENFHLTLAFLAEQPETVLEDLHDLLTGIVAAPVDLDVTGLGTFGDLRPRSVHATVAPSEALADLRRKVRRAAREAGIELSHNRFVPHVTLARFGKGLDPGDLPDLQAWLSRRVARVAGAWRAEAYHLYSSHLDRAGPVYEVLADYGLSASTGGRA